MTLFCNLFIEQPSYEHFGAYITGNIDTSVLTETDVDRSNIKLLQNRIFNRSPGTFDR